MAEGQTTTNHDIIRKWAEARGGKPARIKGTEDRSGEGILRFDFAEPDDKLEPISWEEFFTTFDDRKLALVYQDSILDGKMSRFANSCGASRGTEGRRSGYRRHVCRRCVAAGSTGRSSSSTYGSRYCRRHRDAGFDHLGGRTQ